MKVILLKLSEKSLGNCSYIKFPEVRGMHSISKSNSFSTSQDRFHYLFIIFLVGIILSGCEAPPPSKSKLPSSTSTLTPTSIKAAIFYATLTAVFGDKTPTPTPNKLSASCPIMHLDTNQHVSARGSYTETQRSAAGRMVCRIEPDSCAYFMLVGNFDSTIIFKGEEIPPYNQEDNLMHPAMLLPVSRINEFVKDEWDGEMTLRVTEAYDSRLEHNLEQPDLDSRASLHFEGRAIDLTLWPNDRNNYSRLCALAHCAGFDWVHNEGNHCHAAIGAESLCLKCND